MRRASSLADSTTDLDVETAALITLGSALRQLGKYGDAEQADARAYRRARTQSLRAHALIGQAADRIGARDAPGCARYLARATKACPRSDARARIRLDWVRAEHALLSSQHARAVAYARAALARSRAAGARRHIAKSYLFLGVALDACGAPEARASLVRAKQIASSLGATPVARVARMMLER